MSSGALAGDVSVERADLTPKDLARVRAVIEPASDFSKPEAFEAMPGGAATSRKKVNRDAFSQFSANLTFEQERDFKLGNALFRKLWVSSPSSTQASDGLGPLFNARGCQSCHLKDGRGHPPEGNSDATSMFLRLARPARTDAEREALANYVALNFPDPVYGEQLQDFAVPGLKAEGHMRIDYEETSVTLGDGEVAISLRKPTYSVDDLGYGPMHPDTTLSPRVAPPMIGMGLIQAIEPADIVANADPDDVDGNGISGRVQLTRKGPDANVVIGRFGWKAQNPTIRKQSRRHAFAGDIGISTPDMPKSHGDCTAPRPPAWHADRRAKEARRHRGAGSGARSRHLLFGKPCRSRPPRLSTIREVLRGKEMFYSLGCTSCHTPKFVTSRNAETQAARLPIDLALFGLSAARHGRGACRRPAGWRRHRKRMAHRAALGHRPDRNGQRPHLLSA
jgi:CxxC motif-containing protein (DUF1111 family)